MSNNLTSHKPILVQLFGGPGAGKSTTATGLFSLMKLKGYKVEYIYEYAKELTYQKRDMSDQLSILAKQAKRQRVLIGQVDFIITDSPLLLSAVYNTKYEKNAIISIVNTELKDFECFNIFINRVKPYKEYGRGQTEAEAKNMDNIIRTLYFSAFDSCDERFNYYGMYDGDESAVSKIWERLYFHIKHRY